MNQLKPNQERAKIAIILVLVVLGINFIHLLSLVMQYLLLNKGLTEGVDVTEADANDTREQIISIIYLLVMLVSSITFIRWFRRAYNNLHQKVSYLADAEGWAAGGWFVPIVSLYKPYQIMKEIFEETNKLLFNSTNKDKILDVQIVNIWWAFWIVRIFIDLINNVLQKSIQTIDDAIHSTFLSMASELFTILAGITVIMIIKKYSAVEPLLDNLKNEIDTIGQSENQDEN